MVRKSEAIGTLLASCVALIDALLRRLLMTLRAVLSFEGKALILGGDAAKVRRQIKQVLLVEVVNDAVAPRVFSPKTCNFTTYVLEEPNLTVTMITLGSCVRCATPSIGRETVRWLICADKSLSFVIRLMIRRGLHLCRLL